MRFDVHSKTGRFVMGGSPIIIRGQGVARSVAAAAVVLAVLLTAGSGVFAQGNQARTSAYIEAFGNGGLFSVNLERKLAADVAARVGVGLWDGTGFYGEEVSGLTVPLMLTRRIGSGNHGLEIGGGVVPGRTDEGSFVSLTGLIGYRFERLQGGMVFRAGFTPIYGLGDEAKAYPEKGFYPSIGVSIGYAFRGN